MGTRADYYIQEPEGLRYLGSTGMDGHPEGLRSDSYNNGKHGKHGNDVLNAAGQDEFYNAVADMLASRTDSTGPDHWPWPWDTSKTTDYAYIFDAELKGTGPFGSVHVYEYGAPFHEHAPNRDWPDMGSIKEIVWGQGLGPMVVTGTADGMEITK